VKLLIIPIILIAVIMIAAGFAFVTVEQVSAVHGSLLDSICVIHNSFGFLFDGEGCLSPLG